MNNHELIISGVHLELTDAIKRVVVEKMEKLFKHETRIIRLRIELTHKHTKAGKNQSTFEAKGTIEIKGDDMVVSEESDDLYKSIDILVDKLDRKLRRRSRLDRVIRKDAALNAIPVEVE